MHVAEIYGDDYFFGGGAGYDDYLQQKELLTNRGTEYANLLAQHCMPGRVLDVGSAAGFFLRGFLDCGWEGVGVEPNQRLSKVARDEMHIDSCCTTFEDFASGSSFDAITMVQVILHFIDPLASINKGYDLLKPGGFLLIETWDRASWEASILGSRWHQYSPPSVLHWFTKTEFADLLKKNGFSVIATGHPPRRIRVGHAKSLIKCKYGRLAASTLAWLPDRLTLPYPADDLIWLLARRPTT